MKLIIGGAYQGKRHYAANKYNVDMVEMKDCQCLEPSELLNAKCVYNFHLFVKSGLEGGHDFSEISGFMQRLFQVNQGIIIIMDEVGNGIIPIEKSEREWREAVGRICCMIAENAESVERIVCGCAVKIK